MFETTVGYPILEWEPQEFCVSCAQKLIEWHEYKALCQKTQETLVPMIPIKIEPDASAQELMPDIKTEETDDVKPEMSLFLEPSRITTSGNDEEILVPTVCHLLDVDADQPIESIEKTKSIKRKKIIKAQSIEITFEAYIRYYKYEQLSEKSFIGLMPFSTTVQQKNLFIFRSQLWMAIKKHLIREIVFTNERKPLWTTDVRPSIKEMSRFVEFAYNYSSYDLDVLTNANLRLWNGKQIILHIYPYSRSIKTKDEWIHVTKKLFKFKKQPEKKLKTHHEAAKSDSEQAVTSQSPPVIVAIDPESETQSTTPKNFRPRRTVILTKVKNIPPGVKPKLVQTPRPPIPDVVDPKPTIIFEGYICNYIAEPLSSARHMGPVELHAESKIDLKKQLWALIHNFVIRKALFKPGEYPFNENFPSFYDVDKFVEFRCENNPCKTYLYQMTTPNLNKWRTKKDKHLYVYPYTTAMTTQTDWEEMTKKLISINEIDRRITKALTVDGKVRIAEDVTKMEVDEYENDDMRVKIEND